MAFSIIFSIEFLGVTHDWNYYNFLELGVLQLQLQLQSEPPSRQSGAKRLSAIQNAAAL